MLVFQTRFATAVLALWLILTLLASCQGSGEKQLPESPPKHRVTEPAPSVQNNDLVDCNYYWQSRRRHVCIKDMPIQECEDMFFMPGFQREKECLCDAAGRQKNRIQGAGYVQYDCE